MIDLTPLDVRKKRGDFRKGLRGYETQEVDAFLELVAERLEEVVKENLTLSERAERLGEQVSAQTGRERAVHEALVTAQELRDEIRGQAQKEADQIRRDAERDALHREREAELKARDILAQAERLLKEREAALESLERRRAKFLTAFRQLLQRELDVVSVEEGRPPLADMAVELDLGGGRDRSTSAEAGWSDDEVEPTDPELHDAEAVAPDDDEAPPSLVALSPDDEERPEAEADVHDLAARSGPEVAPPVDDDGVLDIGLLAGAAGVVEGESLGEAEAHLADDDLRPADDEDDDVEDVDADLRSPGAEEARPRSPHGDIPTLEVLLGEELDDDGR